MIEADAPITSATITKTTFLAFGDSVTSGVLGGTVFSSSPYPSVLQSLLSSQYPGQTITTINAGLPGESTADGLIRAPLAIQTYNPDVFLLLEGVNGLGPVPVSWVASDLRTIVQGAQAAGVDVMIATLTPIGDHRNDPGLQADVIALNAQIHQIAIDEGIAPAVDIYGAMIGDPSLIGADGLHPTDAGYALMAQAFLNAIVARFDVPPTATLTVTKTGLGSGTVTTNPGSINCGGVCSEDVALNTVVTLLAAADPGSTFGGFSGDADCTDGTVTMSVARTCNAKFTLAFTDDPLLPGTVSRALHLTQLQQRINAVRLNRCGLDASMFDAVVIGGVIKALHLQELRTSVNEAEVGCGHLPTEFSDSGLGPGTPIRALHITELRAAIIALE